MIKLAPLAALVAALAFPAHAQVNNEMTQMFDQRGNATAPGYVEGSTRGVLTGGGVTIKNPIVRVPDPVMFQPPSINAGCGGIDIQGGYLSIPSAEEFVAVARAVAANAQGYAFKLALSAICDSCEDKMTQIQEQIQQWGAMGKNSCEIAQSIMDSTGASGAITAAGERLGQSLNLNSGEARDNAEAATQPGEETALQRAHSDDPDAVNEQMLGNLVWEAMNENDIAATLGSDAKALKEELMSITGTVIACLPGRDGCPGQDEEGAEATLRVLPPTIRLNDLIAATGDSGNRAKVFHCSGEGCLDSVVRERDLGKTITDRIIEAFVGKDGAPGLIALSRMDPREGAPRPTNEQLAAQAMAGPIGSYALSIASSSAGGERAARDYIRMKAPQAAADYVVSVLLPVVQGTRLALAQDTRQNAVDAVRLLTASEAALRADHQAYLEANGAMLAAATQYELILKNMAPNLLSVGGTGYVPGRDQ